jgi:hypothetical protein
VAKNPIRIELVEPKKSFWRRARESVPLFISLLALGLSIYSGWETRDHNRLSVRPVVRFTRQTDELAGDMGLILVNSGNGPATLSNFAIFLDGKRIQAYGARAWNEVTEKSGDAVEGNAVGYFSFSDGFALKESTSRNLYYTKASSIKDMQKFRDLILSRLVVRVTACSLYEECYTVCSTNSGSCDSRYLSD